MERTARAGAWRTTLGLLVAGPMLAVLMVVAAVPPVDLAAYGLTWITDALAILLATLAAAATLIWLVAGLRGGGLAEPLLAASSAAVAGSALAMLGGAGVSVPLAAAGVALLAASAADRSGAALARHDVRVAVAVGAVAIAEASVLAELVPGLSASIAAGAPLIGAIGIVAAIGAALLGFGLPASAIALTLLLGLAASVIDRRDGLETVIGLAGLAGAQGMAVALGARAWIAPRETTAEPERLPALAGRVSEAVLRFDGRLELTDWNAIAASLLGLDEASGGATLEEILGVRVGELPRADSPQASFVGVAGLAMDLERDERGVTVVIRDPATAAESDQLARELRGTIEELLQARRTIDLQRREIERAAALDPLTSVTSRNAVLERLRTEVAQARRYQHPVAVALIDLDGLESVNRVHGLEAGDTVLREAALRIRLRVREADELGRVGSDSFLAVLPHTDAPGAAKFADAALRRLRLRAATHDGTEIPLSASIGVAVMAPGASLDADGLIARAQEAADVARREGGDRVAIHPGQERWRGAEPAEAARAPLEVIDDDA